MTYTSTCCDDGSGCSVGTIIRSDSVTILLDPGWHSPKVSYEDSVRYWSNLIPEVDVILISQPSLECLGAYALIYYNFLSHFVSRIEVYATLPVTNLGRVSTVDFYVSRGLIGPYESNKIDLEDVEKAFDHIEALKYSQLVDLRSKFDGLSLVAYNAGVSPGGCMWCISTYFEKLLYARRWNHTRDTILNGASLLDNTGKPLSALSRPSAIITTLDKFGSAKPHVKRIEVLKDTVNRVLSSGGSAVLPVEIGGNFLDLLVSIHDFLYEKSKSRLFREVPVLLVSYSRGRTLTYARSMLEWLSSSFLKTWESRDNKSPFELGRRFHVVIPEELAKYPGSKICFVSQVDLLVDEIITKLCQIERTTIILTTFDDKDLSTISKLQMEWKSAEEKQTLEEGRTITYSKSLSLKNVKLQPLLKEELEAYVNKITERKKKRLELEFALKRDAKNRNQALGTFSRDIASKDIPENGLDGIQSGDDDAAGGNDDDDEEDNLLDILRDETPSSARKQTVEVPVDTTVLSSSLPKHKMFPFHPARVKMDDYGAVIDFNFLMTDDEEQIDKNKRRAVDEEVEDEDPYDLSDPRKLSSKRVRRPKLKELNSSNEDPTFDNIDYLDARKAPVRRVESYVKVTVKCLLTFINLESLADQRSASVIWPALKPRKILLLGPKETQNKQLVVTLRKKDIELVEMPFNEDIEFNTTIKSLDISIDPQLDQLLKWQRISDGYTVAHVIARLVKEKPQLAKQQQKPQQAVRTKLILKPLLTVSKIHSGGSLSIGDVRLAELKRKLTGLHYRAEFKGEGTLVVDGEVAVRKINDSETIVDGTPSELFYNVKKLVTDMLAKI